MTIEPDNHIQPGTRHILKTDLLGQISKATMSIDGLPTTEIIRDTHKARWWLRPFARRLANREAQALRHLPPTDGLPALIAWDGSTLRRSFVAGQPMQEVKPQDRHYFKSARRLLRQLHRNGIVHNDTAKEPNWLVLPDGSAGLVDFQLAGIFSRRSRTFRVLAREDIRHLLKHKRSYQEETLTARERHILAHPALHARLWRNTGKRLYLLITRKILNWQDREGAGDRSL